MQETLKDIVVNSSGFYRILLEKRTHAIVLVGVVAFHWDNFQSGTGEIHTGTHGLFRSFHTMFLYRNTRLSARCLYSCTRT
jgi:hypothetical protein